MFQNTRLLAVSALLPMVLSSAQSPTCQQGCKASIFNLNPPVIPAACQGMVSIEVSITNGKCVDFNDPICGCVIGCEETKTCEATIIRSWSGLSPNENLEICFHVGSAPEWCQTPPITTGPTGSGTWQPNRKMPMHCTGETWEWSIESACGLRADVNGACSECN